MFARTWCVEGSRTGCAGRVVVNSRPLRLVVGDVVIRAGTGADEGKLYAAIRAHGAAVIVMFVRGGQVEVLLGDAAC